MSRTAPPGGYIAARATTRRRAVLTALRASPVKPVNDAELKIHFVPCALWVNDLTGYENTVRVVSAAGHVEVATAGLCKAPTVGEHDVFFQEGSELLLLLRARAAPIRPRTN